MSTDRVIAGQVQQLPHHAVSPPAPGAHQHELRSGNGLEQRRERDAERLGDHADGTVEEVGDVVAGERELREVGEPAELRAR